MWRYDGTESLIPLAWDTDGLVHDNGNRHLRKKHCTCCKDSGFLRECRKCVKNVCPRCQAGTDKSKIIRCYYTRKDDVPAEFQIKFYGDINCFLVSCARQGSAGFQTEQDMRMHAMSRHTREFEAHEAVKKSGDASEVASLRTLVDQLLLEKLQVNGTPQKADEELTPRQIKERQK